MQVSFVGDSLPEQGCFWTRTGAVFSDDGKGKDDLKRISGGEMWSQPEDIFVGTTSSCPRSNQSRW